MQPPSSGTITFLFTDIEGSTRRWEDHPRAMSEEAFQAAWKLGEGFDQQGRIAYSSPAAQPMRS